MPGQSLVDIDRLPDAYQGVFGKIKLISILQNHNPENSSTDEKHLSGCGVKWER
jgi:hypothetical protein